MSRSGYSDDCEYWDLIRWRGAVASAIRGRRGQAFLKELLISLDAIPTRSLISGEWSNLHGVCAIGSVADRRHVDLTDIDPEDLSARDLVASRLGIATALAAEIMYENDEVSGAEQRWHHLRSWTAAQIKEPQ